MSCLFTKGDRWYISFRHQKKPHCYSLKVRCKIGKRQINKGIVLQLQAEIDADLRRGKFPEMLLKGTGSAPSLYVFLSEFSAWQRQQKSLYKESTIEHYDYTFSVIKRIITRDIRLDQITERMISKEIRPYLFENLGKRTCHNVLAAMRAAFNIAGKWYDLPKNPFAGAVNKVPATAPEFYTMEEIEVMRKYFAMSNIPDWQGDIVFFILNTGFRRGEAFELKWKDVHLDMEFIIIVGKGDKPRVAALNDAAKSILKGRSGHRKNSDRVFYEVKNVEAFKSAFARLKERTGLPGNIHRLRKTYSTHFANSDGNLQVLQKNLGHKSIQTTMIYTALMKSKLLESKNRVNIYR